MYVLSLSVPPTMVGKLIEKCFRKLTIVEVVTIFGGSADPLASIHGTLREFVKDTLLGGEEPTADNIPQAIEKFIEGLPGMLEELQVISSSCHYIMLLFLTLHVTIFSCHFYHYIIYVQHCHQNLMNIIMWFI